MLKFAVFCLVMLALPALSAPAADWPRFLGPNQNSISQEKGLARQWPQAGPKVLWTVPVGQGFGGASVRQGKVYLLDRQGAEPNGKDVLRCLELATGHELWSFAYDAPGSAGFPGSRSTPTLDEENVYLAGPFGEIVCVSQTTHQPLWRKNIIKDFGGKKLPWGFGFSPFVYKDLLIITPGSKDAGLAALNKRTGALVWKAALTGDVGYTSPLLARLGGVDQVLIVTTKGIAGFEPSSGRPLWSWYGQWLCKIPIVSPVLVGDGRIFITGEYGAGSAMLRVKKNGDKFAVEPLWRTKLCGAQVQQPLLDRGYLYLGGNGNSTHDGLICLDLAGNLKWKTGKEPNFDRGNMILADGLIFIMDGTTGELHLVQPDPAGYKELARAKLLEANVSAWGPMALSGGRLLLRDQKQLKCVDVKSP